VIILSYIGQSQQFRHSNMPGPPQIEHEISLLALQQCAKRRHQSNGSIILPVGRT
jgi:hypothetical protein